MPCYSQHPFAWLTVAGSKVEYHWSWWHSHSRAAYFVNHSDCGWLQLLRCRVCSLCLQISCLFDGNSHPDSSAFHSTGSTRLICHLLMKSIRSFGSLVASINQLVSIFSNAATPFDCSRQRDECVFLQFHPSRNSPRCYLCQGHC